MAVRCPARAQVREGSFTGHDAEDSGSPRRLIDGGSGWMAAANGIGVHLAISVGSGEVLQERRN
jgi:hypothetical protein